MPSSQLKAVLLVIRPNDVDNSGSVLFLIETLQDQVVSLRSLIVNQIECFALGLDNHY